MIHSFSFKNFYSFGELTTLSFVVNDNAPDNNAYFTSPSGTRLSKIETVIGPNASGKTNLLKVIPFLKWLIVNSFNMNPQAPIPLRQFMFKDDNTKPTMFSVVFEIEGKIYTYSFEMNQTMILSEELKVKSKVNENFSNKKLFTKTWNDKNKLYDFDSKNFELPKDIENSLLRTNTSVISVAARFNHKESKDIVNLWQGIETNGMEDIAVGENLLFPSSVFNMLNALTFFSKNDLLKKEAEKLLSRFDLGIEEFNITKENEKNGSVPTALVLHSFGGQKESFPMQYESSGTKQLFVLLKHILVALDQGTMAILDELDVNLHPDMVTTLFELFVHPETNPKNAQLLFSTHNHRVLNELDKYQIILTEKGENGISECYRLDDVSGVRSDDNYYTKYIAGAYGGVPKIQ